MHRVGLTLAGLGATTAALVGTQIPARAATPLESAQPPASCDLQTNVCTAIASLPPITGTDEPVSARAQHAATAVARASTLSDLCRTRLATPQPATSDPVWAGRTGGAIYERTCPSVKGVPTVIDFWAASATTAATTVTAQQLAQQALATLRVPRPRVYRSPNEVTADRAGLPSTWVNGWTWYWTSKASWRQVSKTASLGAVWARVTLTPTVLILTPGDGGAAVTCSGPGRAWTPAAGGSAPGHDGCGYVYRSVSTALTSTLSIRWQVSWTGSGGAFGDLPAMTTRTSSRFAVAQIQAVNS
jgi:hypothetical protein